MIVLDATKSLKILGTTTSATNGSWVATVAYWTVNASNVWTPETLKTEVGPVGLSFNGPASIILPAAAVGEKKVVENIWMTASGNFNTMSVILDDGVESLLWFRGTFPSGKTLTLSRDGLFVLTDPTI